MRFRPREVEATQWFKNGDHPGDYSKTHCGFEKGEPREFHSDERRAKGWEGDVVRYFRHPAIPGASKCVICKIQFHDHGWIDEGGPGTTVCPGDWVITAPNGEHYTMQPGIFSWNYEAVQS